MLEVVLVIFIVGVLVSCAVPNAMRVLDRVSRDYETKRFYTELRFLQSHERMTFMRDSHFDNVRDHRESFQNKLTVYPEGYIIQKIDGDNLHPDYYFKNGVTASKKNANEVWEFTFDEAGRISPAVSNHLTITSRQGKELYFVFDTVGRFRASRIKPKS